MKVCIISDTHNKHKKLKLPKADTIIHCGDFTSMGYDYEIRNFMKWFEKLPYKHKFVIAGNHDKLFEGNGLMARGFVPKNVNYLEDSGVEIEGMYFYGTPVQLPFYNWAFMRTPDRIIQHWKAIPDNTDVLITHSPPYGIMDFVPQENIRKGSESLYWEVTERIKPKLHCFGHLHSNHGIKTLDNTIFVNASVLDEDYHLAYEPILVEI